MLKEVVGCSGMVILGGERGMRRVWDSWTLPVTLTLPHPRVHDPHPSSAGGCAHGLPGWHLEGSWRQLPLHPSSLWPCLYLSSKKLPWEPLVLLWE